MPFSETPHGNAGEPSSSGERRESSTDYEGQRTERRRQEALTHLIETGRAKTPEEAEHYLDSLNRLRNKLLLFVQDLFAKRAIDKNTRSYDPTILTGLPPYQLAEADKSLITNLKLEDVDRTSSKLWDLERTVSSRTHYWFRENLLIPITEASPLRIEPNVQGFTGAELHEYLSQKDLAFLLQEHEFAKEELARALREQADKLMGQQQFENPGWEPLLQTKKE